ncbi:MAG: hypothetical protein DRH08_11865 [Deltaproteobacteria bacterium]|nr:MAG: hypothetical protein DRH08_11865 [Deltaproteobacteria bacterium]
MIPEYSKILYATDLTEHASSAFRHAVCVARSSKAKVYVLHVLPEVGVAVEAQLKAVMGDERFAKMEVEHEGEIAQKICLLIDEFIKDEWTVTSQEIDLVASIEVHHGDPAIEIINASKRLDVDVIVMGTHTKSSLRHAVLGSVAERVLHKSPCPVMIVPLPS